jgi:hypothetical protein
MFNVYKVILFDNKVFDIRRIERKQTISEKRLELFATKSAEKKIILENIV